VCLPDPFTVLILMWIAITRHSITTSLPLSANTRGQRRSEELTPSILRWNIPGPDRRFRRTVLRGFSDKTVPLSMLQHRSYDRKSLSIIQAVLTIPIRPAKPRLYLKSRPLVHQDQVRLHHSIGYRLCDEHRSYLFGGHNRAPASCRGRCGSLRR